MTLPEPLGSPHLEAMIEAVGSAQPGADRARRLLALAQQLDVENRSVEARGVCHRAAAEAEEADDDRLVGWSLVRESISLSNCGHAEGSIECARRAASIFAAAGDELGIARALGRVAADLIDLGRAEDGVEALVAATLAYDRVAEDTPELADAISAAADAYAGLGAFAMAYELAVRALGICQRNGTVVDLGWHLYSVSEMAERWGDALLRHGDPGAEARLVEALSRAEEGIALQGRIPDSIVALLHLHAGAASVALGLNAAALAHLEAADAGDVGKDSPSQEALLALSLARVRSRLGDGVAALAACDRALDAAGTVEGGMRDVREDVLRERAALRAETGDHVGAMEDLLAALELTAGDRDRVRVRRAAEVESQVLLARTRAESRANAEAARLALVDELTGLPNRRAIADACRAAFEESARTGRPTALAVVDVDAFKAVNDERGHLVGDAVLRRVAAILQASARADDVVVRYAGDEFVLVLPRTGEDAALAVATRLRDSVEAEDWSVIAPGIAIGITVGVAVATSDDPWALFAAADQALIDAKREQRGDVRMGA